MEDVMDLPPESFPRDQRKDRSVDMKDRGTEGKERHTESRVRVADDRRREKEVRESREIRESRDRREERAHREERDDRPRRREHHERNSRYEERMTVAGATEKKEREKDNKRRKSPSSPPPYPHRFSDRHPPAMRRSPPYKRTREDDEHEITRRGSLYGGLAAGGESGLPPDQRYAYEGMNPFERAGLLSGRSSGSAYIGERRSHNQYSNYPSAPGDFHGGPPDWPPGRTGFSDGLPISSSLAGVSGRREGLLSYKKFISELDDDILPAEAERRYEEYKTAFISTQKQFFFEQHKDDDWLRELYDPSCLEAVLARRFENAKAAAKDFLAELQAGIFDMGLGANGRGKAGVNNDTGMLNEDAELSGKKRKLVKNSARDKEVDAAPKAPAISSEPKRISKDIEQVQALIKKLDSEKGIATNILSSTDEQKLDADRSVSENSLGPIVIVRGTNQVKGLEGLELLDVMLSYLWQVHGLDYYGMLELKEPPLGLRHVRTEAKSGDELITTTAAEWEKKLDKTWQNRLHSQDPVELMLGREKLEAAATEALDPVVRKIKDDKYGWKYGCGSKGCSKLFHGPEYVYKHLKLKHPEIVNEVILKTREELYLQNYMNDPHAPGATVIPVFHTAQKDRGRKKRANLPRSSAGDPGIPTDSSIPDRGFPELSASTNGRKTPHDGDRIERGAARDNERFDNLNRDEEMFDQVEQSPGREKAPSSGGGPSPFASGPLQGGSLEPPMFNPFKGPAMRGPLYATDIPPPPFLMPVPGAGPLGPFVPAPPEVAMRMWREQGGPPPFHPGAFDGSFDAENNGGSHGRRGRFAAHSIGPGMIDGRPMTLHVPPALPHYTRHARSYHDLDAPEDEVTVIDYRSL